MLPTSDTKEVWYDLEDGQFSSSFKCKNGLLKVGSFYALYVDFKNIEKVNKIEEVSKEYLISYFKGEEKVEIGYEHRFDDADCKLVKVGHDNMVFGFVQYDTTKEKINAINKI